MLSTGLPLTLSRLRNAKDGVERDDAWAAFIADHSDVVLQACRATARDRDAAMDAYAFVLEALRKDDCRRLRTYTHDGRTQFTTWLAVVARRLALDFVRQRYGRSRSDDDMRQAEQAARRRLEDLVAEEIDPDQIAVASESADAAVRRAELASALRTTIEALEPADRLLLALRFEDERPVRDIARALGFRTVFHVYRRLGVVLDQMRRALARRGVEEPDA